MIAYSLFSRIKGLSVVFAETTVIMIDIVSNLGIFVHILDEMSLL